MHGIWKTLPQWTYPMFTVLLKPGSNIPPLNLASLQSIHIYTYRGCRNMPTGGWPVCHVIAKLLSFSSACLLMWDYVCTTFFVLQVLFIKWCVDRGLEVKTCMYDWPLTSCMATLPRLRAMLPMTTRIWTNGEWVAMVIVECCRQLSRRNFISIEVVNCDNSASSIQAACMTRDKPTI